MPGFGTGFAQGLIKSRELQARRASGLAGSVDKSSSMLTGLGNMLSGQANYQNAATNVRKQKLENDKFLRSLIDDTSAGKFITGLFGKVMDRESGKLRPEYWVGGKESDYPNMKALTQAVWQTAAENEMSVSALQQALNLLSGAKDKSGASILNVAPEMITKWMEGYQSIMKLKNTQDFRAALESYKHQAKQDGLSQDENLTVMGMASTPQDKAANLKTQSMEGLRAGAAASAAGKGESFVYKIPGDDTIYTAQAAPGGSVNLPPNAILIKPSPSASPVEGASKRGGMEEFLKKFDGIMQTFDKFTGEDAGVIKRASSLASLKYLKGAGNDELRRLWTDVRQAMEIYLRTLSGAAIRDEEIDNVTAMFMPTPGLDNAQTARYKLQSLANFFLATLNRLDPLGKYGQGNIPKDAIFELAADVSGSSYEDIHKAGKEKEGGEASANTGDPAVDAFLNSKGGK